MSWFEDQAIDAPTAAPPPQAGQFAPTNQGFLDWATQRYGADPVRGGGFVNAQAGGGLPAMLDAYRAATGNQADYQAGPSGDRVNFGQGTQDALTSGGQIWNAAGGGGAPAGGGGGGGGWGGSTLTGAWGGPTGPMPTSPGVVPLAAPAPFVSTAGQLGSFQGPAPVAYQDATLPTAFVGDRQGAALPAPEAYGHENYRETTAADLVNDPGYQWRLKQGLEARENSAAARGMLRGGNTLKALDEYGQGLAAQEFAAVDARRRATNAANNAGQLGAYRTNADVGLAYDAAGRAVNAENYQRGATEAQQGFANRNVVEQQNAAGRAAAGARAYDQARDTWGANAAGQQQNYTQQLGTYTTNTAVPLEYNRNTNAANLADYSARVAAGLGYGNLALGQTQAANTYGIQQGQLGLARQGQAYDQGLQTFRTNYQTQVQDPWARQYQLAQLGQPVRPD